MKKIIRLTERDLTRIVKRVIRESIDYDETTEEFYKIKDILVDLAEKGEFILHINDNRNPNETYGYNKSSYNIKKDVFVRINQPTIMVIVPRSDDKYFGSNFTDLLTRQFEYEFPTMNFSGDYGYSIEVRPKKFMEQGFYMQESRNTWEDDTDNMVNETSLMNRFQYYKEIRDAKKQAKETNKCMCVVETIVSGVIVKPCSELTSTEEDHIIYNTDNCDTFDGTY